MNKMDRVGADFFNSVSMMEKKLGSNPLLMQIPIGAEDNFEGVVDLVRMRSIRWNGDDMGLSYSYGDIPEQLREDANHFRAELLEKIAEEDDQLLEKYLETGELDEQEIINLIKLMTIRYKGVPVYFGSSLKNMGVQPLMDGIVDFLPSPLETPAVTGVNPKNGKQEERNSDEEEPLAAIAFKLQNDQQAGVLTFVRVYSGKLLNGKSIYNANQKKRERVNRLIRMYSNRRENIDVLTAGDIGVAVGFRETRTGDTLCSEGKQLLLEQPVFPDPVISIAIEPKSAGGQAKLESSLERLSREDPTFTVKTDEETGQIIISGMGELHLEVLTQRLLKEYRVDANVGKPQVAYRETIRKDARADVSFHRQIASKDHTGHVILTVHPLPRGEGNRFENRASETDIPRQYVDSVRKGVFYAMERGVKAGYSVIDVLAVLEGGSYSQSSSSEIGYTAAASDAFDEACSRADSVLLEPFMFVEVTTPKEFVGDIIGDLNARGGQINSINSRQVVEKIDAICPLSKMFGYTTDLRSMSQGRASFTMEFYHFAPITQEA
jgi:elongation factor G